MLSKSLIQFSVDGWSCVPYLLFTWGQTMVEVMKVMVTSLKRSHPCTATLSAPNPVAGHRWPTPPLETPGHPQASPGQSPVGSLGPGAHKVCLILLMSLAGMGFDSKRVFASPTILLGLLLCPWMCGLSPHSRSSAYRLIGVSLTLDVGFLHMAGPATHSCRSWP